jgi:hypothetical protein
MIDILLTADGDLWIENGDFKTGDSTQQEVRLLLISSPGMLRENGYAGMDLPRFLDDETGVSDEFKAEFKKQLKLDKKELKGFDEINGKTYIDVEDL